MSLKSTIVCLLFMFCMIGAATARDITTNDGKVYKDVDVKAKINGLTIFHAYGASFERFDNLPKTIQTEFHYDKAKVERYEKKLQLKKSKRAEKLANRQALAKQQKLEAKKAKELLARQQKAKIAKIKPLIQQQGTPVTLSRQVLYNLDAKPLFASSKLTGSAKFFLVYEDYMLVNDKVYLAKDNIISVVATLDKLQVKINELTKSIKTNQTAISKWQEKVDSNDEKINKAQNIIDSYNQNNDHYININKTQQSLIRQYTRDNRELDRKIDKAQKKIKSCKKKLKDYNIDFDSLSKLLDEFNRTRKLSEVPSANKPQPKTQQIKLEDKLKKLKALLDKGLISQAIYDKQSSELITKYLNKKTP